MPHGVTYIPFKCSLTQSSSNKGKSSLFQPFALLSRSWDSWRLGLLVKIKVNKTLSTLAFSMSICHQFPCPIQQQFLVFPSLPFAADVLVEPFLVALLIFCQIQFQVSLGFSTFIPARLDISSILLENKRRKWKENERRTPLSRVLEPCQSCIVMVKPFTAASGNSLLPLLCLNHACFRGIKDLQNTLLPGEEFAQELKFCFSKGRW